MADNITRRLKIYVNGKEVDATITNLSKSLGKFRAASNRAVEGTPEWKKYNKEVGRLETEMKGARAAQKAFRQDSKLTTAGINDGQKAMASFSGSASTLFRGLQQGDFLQIQEGFNGVKSGIKGATSAALKFLATPVGLFLAAFAAIGLGAKQWLSYNAAVLKAIEVTTAITGLTGKAADQARIQAETLQEAYGSDFEKNLETAKKLVFQFGVSYDEAFGVIEDGLKRGQGKNEEYFQSLNEYGVFFKAAGFNAQEFKDVISTGFDLGIYKDKLPDAIKEADLAIKEQTKTTKDALVNAFGVAFTNDLLKRVRIGETTTKEALLEISKQADKANISVQQNAQLTADLFKGAGEDAGGALKVFEALNVALIKQKKPLTESQQLIADQAEETRKLKEINSALFLSGDKGWGLLVGKAKLFGTKTLIKVLESGVAVYNWLVDLNNESGVFSAVLSLIGKSATSSFRIIGIVLKNAVDAFTGLGTIIQGIFTLDPDKIASGFQKALKSIPNLIKGVKDEVQKDVADIYAAFSGKNKMKKLSLDAFTSETKTTTESVVPADGKKGNGELTAEDKKIFASRKKLKELLDEFQTENKILEEIEGLEEDEAAQLEEELDLEEKFAKLEEEAFGEKELLKKLEETKKIELDAIEKKWQAKFWKDYKKNSADLKKEKDRERQEEIRADMALQNAKSAALNFGLGALMNFTKKGSAEYKALFAIQQMAAAAEVLLSGQRERAAYAANPAWSLLPDGGATIKASYILASKIRTGISLASIAATSIQSLDKGGHTFGGSYSGGLDGIGGQMAMIHPDEYMIPKPVMNMPEVPMIVEYLEAKRTGKPMTSLAKGGSTNSEDLDTSEIMEVGTDNINLAIQIERLNNHLDAGLKINYSIYDEVERQKIQDELNRTLLNAKN